MRFFNTAGPVGCRRHYCLPPLQRLDLEELEMLIAQQKYFVLHAPRQTGKTSCLLALQQHVNAGSEYVCLYVNVEGAQAAREDVHAGIHSILAKIDYRYRYAFDDTHLQAHWHRIFEQNGPYTALTEVLSFLCLHVQKPMVLLLDEIDALVGDTLVAVLRQLREGYDQRPAHFPQSIILCGVRDVRDYRIRASSGKEIITGGSAFNVKAESLRLGDSIRSDVEALLAQHTEETGQEIIPEARSCIWHMSKTWGLSPPKTRWTSPALSTKRSSTGN